MPRPLHRPLWGHVCTLAHERVLLLRLGLRLFASTVSCLARFITNVSLVCFITYYTHVHRSIRVCKCVCERMCVCVNACLCHVIMLCPRNKCLNRSALFALFPVCLGVRVCVCVSWAHKSLKGLKQLSPRLPLSAALPFRVFLPLGNCFPTLRLQQKQQHERPQRARVK